MVSGGADCFKDFEGAIAFLGEFLMGRKGVMLVLSSHTLEPISKGGRSSLLAS